VRLTRGHEALFGEEGFFEFGPFSSVCEARLEHLSRLRERCDFLVELENAVEGLSAIDQLKEDGTSEAAKVVTNYRKFIDLSKPLQFFPDLSFLQLGVEVLDAEFALLLLV